MKNKILGGLYALSITSVFILGSCNTSRQTEETETAENMNNPVMETDSASIMNMDNNMRTDSIRAVE